MLYSAIKATRKAGTEAFTYENRNQGITLLDFWKWSVSDLVSNATRGRLAEFIVAKALRVECDVREEWAAYDLLTPDGIKVEVKSAAYMQSWAQSGHSTIQFRCGPTILWESETNRQGSERRRWADVYVFALLHHVERESLDPLKLEQWEFYVVPSEDLNNRTRSQHSLTLTSLKKLTSRLSYSELAERFTELAKRPTRSSEP
jgi:hypothetical protein